jgi:tetratricopeptide (TPR) repeat protein
MMRLRLLPAALALSVLSAPAYAQKPKPKEAPKEAPREKERYIVLFEEAQALYRVGEYEKALPLYKESYLLSKRPEILFNIAQCLRLLGRHEESLRTYRAFLDAQPDTPYRADAEEKIKEVEAAIAAAKPTPATAAVTATPPPGDEGPAPTPKERSPLRFLTPGGFFVGGLLLGGGALLFRANQDELDAAKRRTGAVIAGASDVSFVVSGVTLFFALKKKKAPAESKISSAASSPR